MPLSRQVKAALLQLKPLTGHYQFIFAGRNDVNKPMSEASINMVLKRIGYDKRATGHGFRHTMSPLLHEQNFNTAWIETQLAHVDKNAIRGRHIGKKSGAVAGGVSGVLSGAAIASDIPVACTIAGAAVGALLGRFVAGTAAEAVTGSALDDVIFYRYEYVNCEHTFD